MAKVKVKRNVKAASFELLTDFTPERKCSSCGLLYRDFGDTPFLQFDRVHQIWKPVAITEFKFCPMCGKPLKMPRDLMPGYEPEGML